MATARAFETDPLPCGEVSSNPAVIAGRLFRVRGEHGALAFASDPPPARGGPRPLRIAQTLALAHKLDRMLEAGEFATRTEIAIQLEFTTARVTQIMNLLWLAPDIQEEILHATLSAGIDWVTERQMQDVLRASTWAEQRERWLVLRRRGPVQVP